MLTQARPRRAAIQPSSAAHEIAAALRDARSQAIAAGHPVAFRLHLDARRFQIGEGQLHALPEELALSMTGAARGIDENRNQGSMFFAPDGSASGGRIVVGAGGRRIVLTINWLNGLVTVQDAP